MNTFLLMLATIGAGVWLAWALAADRADAAAENRAQAALSRRITRRVPRPCRCTCLACKAAESVYDEAAGL
jgi:hypothetical protein